MTDHPKTIGRGRYIVSEKVGRGAMGVLYRAVDTNLDREVAIKVMASDFAADADDDAKNRFFREARAAAKLVHKNIVTIFEFAEEENGLPYIVMEFLRGQSLSARMKQDPPLSLDEKLDIVTELCTGLQFAHENGVVHRDVKPSNVWLHEGGSVKLLDFGIAKISSSTLTRHGDVLGSASYMAPEQVSGGPVDSRADIFSTAVLLYELVAGRTPFESDSPTSTILRILQEPPAPIDASLSDLPSSLLAVVEKGLQKNPADRYQTAGDLGAELYLIRTAGEGANDTVFLDGVDDATLYVPLPSQNTLVADHPLLKRDVPPPVSDPGRKPAPSTRKGWIAGSAITVLLVGGVLWFAMARTTANKPSPEATAPSPPIKLETKAPVAIVPKAPVLHVVSEPDGATIDVDGTDTGLMTPADVKLGNNPRRIRLAKKGFQAAEGRITDAVLENGSMSLRLLPELASVRVTASGSYPFEVLDGKRVLSRMATSHEFSVPSQRVLRLQAPGYFLDFPIKIDAAGGRTTQIQAPELGKLTVRSAMETCQVVINGRDLGFPPVNSQLIAAGTYSVLLKCPDGQTVRGAPVTIVAGQTMIAKVP